MAKSKAGSDRENEDHSPALNLTLGDVQQQLGALEEQIRALQAAKANLGSKLKRLHNKETDLGTELVDIGGKFKQAKLKEQSFARHLEKLLKLEFGSMEDTKLHSVIAGTGEQDEAARVPSKHVEQLLVLQNEKRKIEPLLGLGARVGMPSADSKRNTSSVANLRELHSSELNARGISEASSATPGHLRQSVRKSRWGPINSRSG